MSKRIKIIFTGGGSAGHVTPNLPLISAFKRKGASVFYLGSETIKYSLLSYYGR